MKPRNYFPLGKAYGDAFCNRVEETKWLVGNLNNTKHTLLIAPRRYGKSSLAEKAIVEANLPFVRINFHLCTAEEEIAQLIVSHIIKLIGKAIGQVEKIIAAIKQYATNFSPKLSFGDDIATLELIPKPQVNQAVIIAEALLLMEKLLKDKDKKAVIFFDEFQEITKINKHAGIEGAIRTAAQEMQNLSIIFSGSVRSLLLSMFDDESRPLYKLCRKLKLDRISAGDYHQYINKVAMATWGKKLDEAVFNEVMRITNRHPYYVNYLCDVIWEENEQLPTVDSVRQAWDLVVEEEWSDVLKEIAMLSLNQRKFLKFIATHQVTSITNHETISTLQMPASTIISASEALTERDYIELNAEGCYQIINPLLATIMATPDF